MNDDVVVEHGVSLLARPCRGHFDLGTGYHGDVWLDLDTLFLRPALLRPYVRTLADRLRGHQADAVRGPMEGGAFLAQAIADHLTAAFLPAARAAAPWVPGSAAYTLPQVPEGIGVIDDGESPSSMTPSTPARPSGTALACCAAGREQAHRRSTAGRSLPRRLPGRGMEHRHAQPGHEQQQPGQRVTGQDARQPHPDARQAHPAILCQAPPAGTWRTASASTGTTTRRTNSSTLARVSCRYAPTAERG
jgi:hypothetical protein